MKTETRQILEQGLVAGVLGHVTVAIVFAPCLIVTVNGVVSLRSFPVPNSLTSFRMIHGQSVTVNLLGRVASPP